jgi:hypothetical protein
MVNYGNGKIYKIESHLGDKIYIGSTTKEYLSQRMDTHRSSYNSWKHEKRNRTTSFELFDVYGIENCQIVLIESCPCNSKDELISREAFYIRSLDCVNKNIPDRSPQELGKTYRKNNKEIIIEKKKLYYEKNKETILEAKKQSLICECGKHYTIHHKARHDRTIMHTKYLESLESNQ